MLPLTPPTHPAKDTFETCISSFPEPYASCLKDATLKIVCAAENFDNAAKDGAIHDIPCHTYVTSNITNKDMKTVYEEGMRGGYGRKIYNDIIASPPHERCPLCMERRATTLDHYLPKSHFPSLAVAPLNLIPTCPECNNIKGNKTPRDADDVPLHPYYDDLGNDIWLTAKIVQPNSAALEFFITKPSHWTLCLHKRVENHFKLFKLAELFATKAMQELISIRWSLTKLRKDSVNKVKKHLQDEVDRLEKEHRNSWRVASYRAWSQCDWFCDGGFLQS